jgi:ribosome-associated toxin RatA of RatAB toxin-antitoxin module
MPRVEKDIIVNAPSDTVYQIWRNFENFPNFMENIDDVRTTGHARTHWKSRGPLGQEAEWDAEMTVDDPGRAIGWSSVEGSSVQTAGRVDFVGEDGVTHVHVELQYDPPGGTVGAVATRVFANPDKQVETDLVRFKEAAERGREFSGFNYYMPKDEADRPNQVQERTTISESEDGEAPAGPGAATERPRGSHERATRKGKRSTKTGTPGGALGTPTPDEIRTQEALSEKGVDLRADKPSWG